MVTRADNQANDSGPAGQTGGHAIIAFSSNDWSDIPSSTSQIMMALARRNTILCIDTLGIRSPKLSARDGRRAWGKLKRAFGGLRHIKEGLYLWSPVVIPFHSNRRVRWMNGWLLELMIKRHMRHLKMHDPIVYAALPSAVDVVERIGASKTIYHCVDDYGEFTDAPREAYEEMEKRLLRLADLTVVSAKPLMARREQYARKISYVPHGVNLGFFAEQLAKSVHLADLDDLEGPVAGFVGRIGDWIDVPLIARCAREMPDWNFVVIGPTNIDVSPFANVPNLRFLGMKAHEEIPHYIQRFDVCLLPFVDNKVTVSVNPLKVYEYLAVGKPVVSVPMPEIEGMSHVVRVAKRPEFPAAIRDAHKKDTPEQRARRIEAVATQSWGVIAERIMTLLLNGREEGVEGAPSGERVRYGSARKAQGRETGYARYAPFKPATRARLHEHLDATMAWLCRAQDVSADGGVSAGYTLGKGWSKSFPETTGYIIPTFFNYHFFSGGPRFATRALRMADWLLDVQLVSGAFPGGVYTRAESHSVFDTGQILFGLIRAYEVSKETRYLDAAERAGAWLISTQKQNGAWSQEVEYLGKPHVYNTRVAWVLLLLHAITGEDRLREGAQNNIEWVLSLSDSEGFYDNLAFDPLGEGEQYDLARRLKILIGEKQLPSFYTRASLHTIAYTIQGLLECAWILGHGEAEACALRGASVLAEHLRTRKLAGYYGRGWSRESGSLCLTGLAQMAIVWQRLIEKGHEEFVGPVENAIELLLESQSMGGWRPQLRGAFAGSAPIWGRYLPFRYPNWAAKFAADAYQMWLVFEGGSANRKKLKIW